TRWASSCSCKRWHPGQGGAVSLAMPSFYASLAPLALPCERAQDAAPVNQGSVAGVVAREGAVRPRHVGAVADPAAAAADVVREDAAVHGHGASRVILIRQAPVVDAAPEHGEVVGKSDARQRRDALSSDAPERREGLVGDAAAAEPGAVAGEGAVG